MDYILVLISTILLAFSFALQKNYQRLEDSGLISGLKFNMLSGFFTAIIFFALSGFKIEFSLFSLILAFAMALFSLSYTIIGFKILEAGGMALYSIFLMSGGMLLPYFYGVLFLNEKISVLRIIGVSVVLIAVIISNKTATKLKATIFLLCAAIFILNGLVSIVSKYHQINTDFYTVSSTTFVMFSGIAKFLFSSVALLFCKGKLNPVKLCSRTALLVIVVSALINGLSYMLQLIGAKTLPATVLYPMVTGGSIIFSALSGKVFFKEKLSVYQLVSISLCFIGTLLFL